MAFESLLDERLAGLETSRRDASNFNSRTTAATYGFFFLDSHSRSIAVAAFSALRSHAAAPEAVIEARRKEPCDRLFESAPRPAAPKQARRFSRSRRAAIEQLLALGARIGEDSTPEELRSAFRALARRYHPDSHAGASAADKAALAAQFARMCDAYRLASGGH